LLSINGFFPLCYGFFVCVIWSTPCSCLSDPWCYLQTTCVSADIFLSVVDFFLSFTPGHLCITPVYSEWLMCYVLLVIQLLRMNGFFPLCYGFFPVCHGLHRAVVNSSSTMKFGDKKLETSRYYTV